MQTIQFFALTLLGVNGLRTGTGSATYDVTPDESHGKCTYPAGTYPLYTSVGPSVFGDSTVCGMCIKVTNTKTQQSTIVHVADQCIGCGPGDLNMNLNSFRLIGNPDDGRIPISWEEVRCTDSTGNLSYNWEQGSNKWYAAAQIRNNPQPIKSLEFFVNGQWVAQTRRSDNHFIVKVSGDGPYKARVTGEDGKSVEDNSVPILEQGGAVVSSGNI
jgi:expansin (peptidoglycan-binding protein)